MPKKKAKHRQGDREKTEGTISRRNVLKIGAAAGAVTVLAPNISLISEAQAQESIPIPLAQCNANPDLIPHTPFKDELPIPFPAIDHPLSPPPQEVANTPAEADRDNHQRWAQFTPAHITTQLE